MACCAVAAYIIFRIIDTCEKFDAQVRSIWSLGLASRPNRSRKGEKQTLPDHDSQIATLLLSVQGMTCSACTSAIETAVESLKGVHRVSVSLALSRVTVLYDNYWIGRCDITAAIEGAGYDVVDDDRTSPPRAHAPLRAKFRQAAIASAMVGARHILAPLGDRTLSFPQLIQLVEISLGCYVQLYDARLTHKNGWSRNGQFRPALNMDSLISFSIILSLGVSFFNLAVLPVDQARTYYCLWLIPHHSHHGGRYLDAFLKRRGANNLANLYRLQVETAGVEASAGEARKVNELAAGDETLTAVVLRRQNDSALERLIASVSSAVTDRVFPTYVRSAMQYFAPAMIAIACPSFCCTLIWNNDDAAILGLSIARARERSPSLWQPVHLH